MSKTDNFYSPFWIYQLAVILRTFGPEGVLCSRGPKIWIQKGNLKHSGQQEIESHKGSTAATREEPNLVVRRAKV